VSESELPFGYPSTLELRVPKSNTGLLTIIRKNRLKEKEMRVLFL